MEFIEKSIGNYSVFLTTEINELWNGEKFPGSFGVTKLFECVDYWTLRKRSEQLFKENIYAKGIVRRLLRNEIYTGLVADASINGTICFPKLDPIDAEDLAIKYSETLTEHFKLYGESADVFDYRKQLTFGEWQKQVRFESLICGDGIIVSRINKATNLPCWDFINGNHIKDPTDYTPRNGNTITHGVERNAQGQHVAYHVEVIRDGKLHMERIPVRGEKSGRLIAKMVYGTEYMLDEVRGEPLLSCILYMLKELDRYRDAEARAAVVNAMLALFVKKNTNSPLGSRPTDSLARLQNKEPVQPQNAPKMPPRDIRGMQPGTIFDDLAPGEEIQSFQTNRPNVNYKAFEEAILAGICWALEIPPEIVQLRFQSNYSASRQANNEFEVYLKAQSQKNALQFCQPVYEEFVIQSALNQQIDVPGLISACFDTARWKERSAWLSCSWTGLNRPAVDPLKEVDASYLALDAGLSTYDIECRRISGLSFRQVMQRRKREEDFMQKIGFTPKANENNNGEPADSRVRKLIEESEKEEEQ